MRFILMLLFFVQGVLAAESRKVVPVLKIVDAIHVGTAEVFQRAVKGAQESGAPALIIELDTPGGLLESTREIVQTLLNTEFPVIVWVTPQGARAASAGAMITMAAHYAAMSPSTNIGAATPVSIGGGEAKEMGESMKAKITNDTVAFVEGIATKRNRDVEFAKKSVTEAKSISADEALKKNVIDGVHANREDLWKGVVKKFPNLPPQVEFADWQWSLREKVLSFLSNPNLAYALLGLGVLCIYVEITNPGAIIPGIVGAVSLALGAITMKILPIQTGAVVLLFVGLILLIIEVFTAIPTFGLAGILGVVALVLSGVFLMDGTQTDIHLDPSLWLPILVVIVGFFAWIAWMGGRSLRHKENLGGGADVLVGEEARVSKILEDGHEAYAHIRGELWRVRWDEKLQAHPQKFEKDMVLKVTGYDKLVAFVTTLEKKEN